MLVTSRGFGEGFPKKILMLKGNLRRFTIAACFHCCVRRTTSVT